MKHNSELVSESFSTLRRYMFPRLLCKCGTVLLPHWTDLWRCLSPLMNLTWTEYQIINNEHNFKMVLFLCQNVEELRLEQFGFLFKSGTFGRSGEMKEAFSSISSYDVSVGSLWICHNLYFKVYLLVLSCEALNWEQFEKTGYLCQAVIKIELLTALRLEQLNDAASGDKCCWMLLKVHFT